ncbi:hypothetical protein BDF22DRAFT_695494 [Syncephalis plumigaleata]|nr:hypothetical protein BDF22DRAFT_695494 [Syncephalis plumigaleata]
MRSFSLIVAGILAYVATANQSMSQIGCVYLQSLNPQCANPKCESECDRNEQGCGKPICHLSDIFGNWQLYSKSPCSFISNTV